MLNYNYFTKHSSLLAINSLYVCAISGILLCFHYEPFHNQFQSTQEITYLVPFGWFVRYIHFISAQISIVFALFHASDYLLTDKTPKVEVVMHLNFAIVLLVICAFTGFVLKYDQEGKSALSILRTLVEQIPFLGNFFRSLIFGNSDGLHYFYIYHCIIIPALIYLLLKRHMLSMESFGPAYISLIVIFTLLYFKFFTVSHDISPDIVVEKVYAPWFLWGIQFLLKYIPSVVAGVVIPLIMFLIWMFLPLTHVIFVRMFLCLLIIYFLAGILFRIGVI